MNFQKTIFFFPILLLLLSFYIYNSHSSLLLPSKANAMNGDEDCSGCKVYKCMDEHDAHCGSKGYLLGYGEPNCERFNSKEIYDRFNRIGKRFVNCTGNCLVYYMKHYISDHKSKGIDCEQLREAGFSSHPTCYMDCNFCEVCKTNKLALFRAYRLRDFFSMEAIRQVIAVMRRCGMFNCLLGKKNDGINE